MGVKKANCTETVIGKVVELKDRGGGDDDGVTLIFVEYQVDEVSYVVRESLKYRSEVIKLGFLPIGQRKVPKMGETRVGSSAKVSYNPENPAEAFITENIGKVNS